MPRIGRPREFDEDRVVEDAKNLFWSRGYQATSVQDLVDGVGVKAAIAMRGRAARIAWRITTWARGPS